ncbi:tRNA pseudouridine(13) synthase TruD [Thiocapsa imhoffii]|uniref:tRNA pseudouridine(13) synthase TruD n=1 Tax=Thiocapsa imhoffii TaxID=382777 RepID=UPI0030B8D8C4
MTEARETTAWAGVEQRPRAAGAPLGQGLLRVCCDDFHVEEQLGFEPDEEGEHLLLWVRKRGANTEWAARRLAHCAGVAVSSVGYAGLKDRHAVTLQWFSLPWRGHTRPDWTPLAQEGIWVLACHRHRRKLKRGALAGNRFRIRVRTPRPLPLPDLVARLAQLRRSGVPNYFGAQRFGHGGANLSRADELFAGTAGRVSRHRAGLWLSAVRAQLFNDILAERVQRGDWDQPLIGDCLQLAGTHSFFPVTTVDERLQARCQQLDLHPTGALWGRGELPTDAEVRALEERMAARVPSWCTGLASFGLSQERRALRVPVAGLTGELVEGDLLLDFSLPAGAYATMVLREILDCSEATDAQRTDPLRSPG